ncbi:hypothetical protein TcasGA2_TC004322 [Tribolium castaneum]|uniref:Uncharacterized protein n=1 Tax=Tribolium castaneum TaxID=7070 RepID=D6X135_TRICA|nr:hypothetical protein TcasGA2_TC004322 [Tribolium castaneum]
MQYVCGYVRGGFPTKAWNSNSGKDVELKITAERTETWFDSDCCSFELNNVYLKCANCNFGKKLQCLNLTILDVETVVSRRWNRSNGPPMRINSLPDCFQPELFNGIENPRHRGCTRHKRFDNLQAHTCYFKPIGNIIILTKS